MFVINSSVTTGNLPLLFSTSG